MEEGKRIIQETRRWDENKDATFAMRSRRTPRTTDISLSRTFRPWRSPRTIWSAWKAELPELAEEKMARYQREWSLPAYDTEMITGQKALADFF